jgi:hypothetical protein
MLRRILFLILALAAAVPAQAQEPLTASSIRAMAPDVLTRRLLGESATIAFLERPDQRAIRVDNHGTVMVYFRTRPTASFAAGICETQFLSVGLDPVGAPGPDAPLRVSGIYTSGTFIVQEVRIAGTSRWPNAGPNPGQGDEARSRLAAACAAIDPRRAELVLSEGAEAGAIGRAVALVTDLAGSARAGRLPVPTACTDVSRRRLSREACLHLLAALRVETLNSVRLIDDHCAILPRRTENRCMRVLLWDAQHSDRIEIDFLLSRDWLTLIRVDERWEIGYLNYD